MHGMQSQKKKRRSNATLASTRELWRQWQQLAAAMWAKHSGLSAFQAARRIQQSRAGKKRADSPLRYSVSYIAKTMAFVIRYDRPTRSFEKLLLHPGTGCKFQPAR